MLYDSVNLLEGSDIQNLTIESGTSFPASPVTAQLFFRSDVSKLYAFNGTTWSEIIQAAAASSDLPKITSLTSTDSTYSESWGASIPNTGGYLKVLGNQFVSGSTAYIGSTALTTSFSSSSELRAQVSSLANGTYLVYVTNPDGSTAVYVSGITVINPSFQYLVVGGGGGAGGSGLNVGGGGGGAGGYLAGSATMSFSSLNILVGLGGNGGAYNNVGTKGGDSRLYGTGFDITAEGGGRGGTGPNTAGNGGSGGGVSANAGSAGQGNSGPPRQGYNGSLGSANYGTSGGSGGGGGGAGGNAAGNAGGFGVVNSITGTATTYAVGGQGGIQNDGGSPPVQQIIGGGGNASGGATTQTSQRGANGIVVVSYPVAIPAAASVTGNPAVSIVNGSRVYVWTQNGSITF